ncbi:MAG TPA: 16S rRNA (guanine(966)-N(2))-methyltransferase RsmD [Nevskiaceae bacterium]|nr:16S rRNA (guanine(966)-N(2))-methyltransferase RsmD [Nevskiaceae bacterium]
MKRAPGELRLIGGQYRSRRLAVPDLPGLRPTPDRVRQTLFDWLAPVIEGARVLDAFAGSGALGLEALSRGAARVCFIEQAGPAVAAIRSALASLGASERAELIQADALSRLRAGGGPYDLVFLDPPYAAGLLAPALAALPGWLAPGHRIYLEWPGAARPPLPAGARWLREKQAGQVSFGLLSLEPPP